MPQRSLAIGFLQHLTEMEDLAIGGCGDITTLSNQAGFQHLSSLQKLQIYGCSVLENLPHELHKPSSRTFLEFEGCPSIYVHSQRWDCQLYMLTHITIENFQALECLPERLLRGSSNPQYLCISGCSSHTSPP